MNVYQIVTEKILQKLREGVVPWERPWTNVRPQNLISRKSYRGINVFLLGMQGYGSPFWATWNQIKQLGGSVKRGEKSTIVVFWKLVEKEDDDEKKTFPVLRYYRVFNVEQCEGIEVPKLDANPDFEPLEECERTIKNMPHRPEIINGGAAYYDPNRDLVCIPAPTRFKNPEHYYSTLFHELAHSTGHESRLGRKSLNGWAPFGSEDYSREELVAEMTAAFLSAHHGIETATIDNSAAYIDSWLKALSNDPKAVVWAASQAEKASDYILGKEVK